MRFGRKRTKREFHRVISGDPSLLPRVRHLREQKRKQRRIRRGGFIENLLYTAKCVELSEAKMDGDCKKRLSSELRDPCATTKSMCTHEAREVVRRAVWRGIEKDTTDRCFGLFGALLVLPYLGYLLGTVVVYDVNSMFRSITYLIFEQDSWEET